MAILVERFLIKPSVAVVEAVLCGGTSAWRAMRGGWKRKPAPVAATSWNATITPRAVASVRLM